MRLFIIFTRRWYHKKRFIIPMCSLIALFIGTIILGSVLGTKSNSNPTGMIFAIIFSSKVSDSSFFKRGLRIVHTFQDIETAGLQAVCHLYIFLAPPPNSFSSVFRFAAKHSWITNSGWNQGRNLGQMLHSVSEKADCSNSKTFSCITYP